MQKQKCQSDSKRTYEAIAFRNEQFLKVKLCLFLIEPKVLQKPFEVYTVYSISFSRCKMVQVSWRSSQEMIGNMNIVMINQKLQRVPGGRLGKFHWRPPCTAGRLQGAPAERLGAGFDGWWFNRCQEDARAYRKRTFDLEGDLKYGGPRRCRFFNVTINKPVWLKLSAKKLHSCACGFLIRFSLNPNFISVGGTWLRQVTQRAAESEEREYHLKVECKRLGIFQQVVHHIDVMLFISKLRQLFATQLPPVWSKSWRKSWTEGGWVADWLV